MKHSFHFYKYLSLAIVLSVLASCSNDDDFIKAPPHFDGKQQLMDTLTLGSKIELHPKLSKDDNTIYEWTLADESLGNDSTYVFTPEERGDYEITLTASNDGGDASLTYKIHTYGAYENGFFLFNEGWTGHGTGSVSFYRYDTQKLEDSVYVKTNPEKDLKPSGATLEFGTVFREELYLVTKVGGPLVVADAYSLKEKNRIPAQNGNDWRAFVGLNNNEGLLSSSDGVYKLDLETLQTGEQLSGISGQVGDMIKAGDYVFILSQKEGIQVLNASTLEVEKAIPNIDVGFAKTDDDKIWAAGGNKLLEIDAETLNVEEIDMGFKAQGSWGSWHPGSIVASSDAVFIAMNPAYGGGKEVYKYTGEENSFSNPFISLSGSKILYGAGLGYDHKKDRLVINTVDDGFGENFAVNNLIFYDANSGQEAKTTAFSGYYFPSGPVFH